LVVLPDTPGTPQTRHARLEVRPLETADEYASAVELQRLTWGAGFRDVVPAAILKVTQRIGGIAAGAFGRDGTLAGFVYGLTGFYDNRIAHWSHMIAVRPAYRDKQIGRRLKQYQLETVRAAGVDWVYWSFDPLVARNAHLNLNIYGVEIREYVEDMYGNSGSELHAFGTDRFIVRRSTEEREERKAVAAARLERLPILNELEGENLAEALALPAARIEIPARADAMSVAEALAWRKSTRRVIQLTWRSHSIAGFGWVDDRCFYLLTSNLE
jgi:predicted GNAT superfamily acetyltransferase